MTQRIAPILGRKIKFALIGCGRISKNHLEALEHHSSSAELVGLCDTDPSALESATQKYKVPGFKSIDEMLSNCDADIYSICTPSGLHAQQSLQVIAQGKHVMSEKPMATRWNDGLMMTEAAEKKGVHLFVVKQNRHNPTLQILKKAIQEKRFGRIYMANVNVFWTRPQEYYDQAAWRGTWEFDGGALMNQASHYVDLLDWLIGPLESVQGYIATLARNIEVEDTAAFACKWRSGTLGSINVTMLTYPQNLEGSITIMGEKGTVRIGGVAVNKVEHWKFQDQHPIDEEIKNINYETSSVYGFGHRAYYNNVIQSLQGKEEPSTNGREGLNSLEILIASYKAANEGKKVSFPLVT